MNRLERPITRSTLDERYIAILAVMAEVSELAGGPAYLPFQNYGSRELRAQQGYLTKFPRALVELLLPYEVMGPPGASTSPPAARISRGQGYLADAEKRAALERHAVSAAVELYRRAGATRIDERGKPFDLLVVLDGAERHVEVKGSSGVDLGSVQLTQGEVLHASDHQPTDLVVVDEIVCWRDAAGVVRTSGGRLRVWRDWKPDPASLTPTHLRYELPGRHSGDG